MSSAGDIVREELAPILTPDQRVRVFISSTLVELAPERLVARSAVQSHRLHPVMFEMGARPYPPKEVYRALLEQSHVYVGIFWQSYGLIAPGSEISGLEDEFNLSAGMPRLLYVKAAESREPRLEQLLQRIRDEAKITYCPFVSNDELRSLIENDLAQLLSDSFHLATHDQRRHGPLPSYLSVLQAEINSKAIIQRSGLIEDCENALDKHIRIVLTGAPGVGKTYLLGEVGAKRNAVYISLRGKSTQQVFSYLANQLAARGGRYPESLPSESEARDALQAELANSSALIMIDDADQNAPVVRALLGLEFFNCPLIVATRSAQEDFYGGLTRLDVPPFTLSEVSAFLEAHRRTLPPGELQRLTTSSHGNPLYLFYFVTQQISLPPEGLQNYQRALWDRLTPQQQEALALIAHSHSPLDTSDLQELFQRESVVSENPMDTLSLCRSIHPLLHEADGRYEFFHPYFREHVLAVIAAAGLTARYHQLLGNLAVDRQRVLPAAYHLHHAGDPHARNYLFNGARVALLHGEWQLAELLLLQEIGNATDEGDRHAEAAARYSLAEAYREAGRNQDARREADIAIDIYEKLGDTEWVATVRMWSCTLLTDEGRVSETIDALLKAAAHYRGKDALREANAWINLSYAYLQVSRFQEGADAARRALDLFTEQGDERGIYGSLVNLSACVGHLGQLDLQEEYAGKTLAYGREKNLPRVVVAGLNHLAVVQRRRGDYISAERALREGIEICQRMGFLEAEIMNIVNLGNALRDQQKYGPAESAYLESLSLARERNLPKQEGFAAERLADLKVRQGNVAEAVRFGTEALALHKRFGDSIRIASTHEVLARAAIKLGESRSAAEHHEEAARVYEAIDMAGDAAAAYGHAANLWYTLNDRERGFSCASRGVDCALRGDEPAAANNVLIAVPPSESVASVAEYYSRTLRRFLDHPSEVSFTSFMINYAVFCKRQSDANIHRRFRADLGHIVEVLAASPKVRFMNALAVALEQSTEALLPTSETDDLAMRIAGAIDHLYYRSLADGVRVWTIGLEWEAPLIVQITCMSIDQYVQRVAMAVALILLAHKDRIGTTVAARGGNQEKGFSFQVCTHRDLKELMKIDIPPSTEGEHMPASFSASNVPYGQTQPPTTMILHDDYEYLSDWARHPQSKSFPWVLMNVNRALVQHCCHRPDNDHNLAVESRELCEAALL